MKIDELEKRIAEREAFEIKQQELIDRRRALEVFNNQNAVGKCKILMDLVLTGMLPLEEAIKLLNDNEIIKLPQEKNHTPAQAEIAKLLGIKS